MTERRGGWPGPRMGHLDVRFPDDVLKRIGEYARRHSLKRGEVVRRAVGAGLDKIGAEEEWMTDTDELAEAVARQFHRHYDRLSAAFGWTPQESARGKDFDELPGSNRALLIATARGLLDAGVIVAGPAVTGEIRETK